MISLLRKYTTAVVTSQYYCDIFIINVLFNTTSIYYALYRIQVTNVNMNNIFTVVGGVLVLLT